MDYEISVPADRACSDPVTVCIIQIVSKRMAFCQLSGSSCNVIGACSASILLEIVGMGILGMRMPVSYYLMKYMFLIVGVGALRFTYRILRMLQERRNVDTKEKCKNTMIVGGGEAGAMIIKEFQNSRFLNQKISCVIDDNPSKQGKYLRGIKIAGGREDIHRLAREMNIDEIIVAMPSAPQSETKEILNICKDTGCELKVLPGLYQMIKGEVSISKLRKVEIEDLLGREPIRIQLDAIMGYVSGKTVLITGGGGSIGSELCRQVAAHTPKRLIIVDIYENNAYDIQQELKRNYPELDLVVLIASVRNEHRINSIFEKYRPDIVYHAAAHKHVPLMEDSPNEAIKNNVFGTYKTAMAADKYGVEALRTDFHGQGGESHQRHGRVQAYVRDDHSDDEPSFPDRITWRCVSATCWAATEASSRCSRSRSRRAVR